MRDGWARVPLGDVLAQVHRPVSVEGLKEVPFAGVRWYAEGVYRRDTVPAKTVKTKTLNEIRSGDVVYNRMWATKASFGVVGDEADGCLVTNDFPIFVADSARIARAFVGLIFEWAPFQTAAALSATGTTERRRLHERDFIRIVIPVPSLQEQERIVDLTDALDNTIAATQEAAESCLVSRERRLESVFSRGERVEVGSLVQEIQGGRSPKAEDVPPEPGEPGVLKVSAVTSAGFVPGAAKRLDDASLFSPHHRVSSGDVLITRANTAEKVGQVCLVDRDYPNLYLSDKTLRLIPAHGVNPEALVAAMNAPLAREQLSSMSTGTSASMKNVSQQDIRRVRVAWPENTTATGEVDQAFLTTYRKHRDTLERLRALRSNLLAALLSGEHLIPELYDAVMGELVGTGV